MSDWKNVQYKDGKFKTGEGGGGGSSTFAALDDVSFSDLQNGQVPKYNSTTQKWENANESGGGGTVTDVEVDGQSVVNAQGVAEITMPTIPVKDVEVDGQSVVNAQGVAEITMPTPPTPDYPVTDVKVNGTSVVSNKQALITSYKEVTQAQYEALPDTKLSDNVLYAIKDGGQAVDGFPPLIYSDEEREVGVWRDGKPLYQKTLSGNLNSGTQTTLLVDNTMEYKNAFGYLISGNSAGRSQLGCYLNSSFYNGWHVSEADRSFYVFYSSQFSAGKYSITLQYTKTTDIAGSGTWNQQGGYAHHYSTSEKVIGTWIDGKPLYERVLINTARIELIADTWVKTEFDKGSIGKIIKCNLTNITYLSFHSGLSAGFVDDKLAINSARSMSYAIEDCAIVLQYTKTTD